MPHELVVGIDVGTTHTKAVLFEPGARVVRLARVPTPVRRLADGGAVHALDELAGAVEVVVRECVASLPAGARVAAIGLASMAEAGAPLDDAGRPLADLMAWFDPRPVDEARAVGDGVGASRLFGLTGLRPEPKYGLPKLLWLRRHGGAVVADAVGWASVADLLAQRLTGSLATVPSLACRTMLFDLATGDWNADLLALGGLRHDAMPRLLGFGEPVGGLTREAGFRLGLPSGVPIAIAGHDHPVGALGVGVVAPGGVLDSLGTAEAVLMVTDHPLLEDRVRLQGFSVGAHPLPGRFYLIAGLPAAGALVEWFVDTFMASADRPLRADERWSTFARLLAAAPRGPTGIHVDPAWRGRIAPSPDPSAAGSIRGLRFEHTLADLALATVEGIAFQVRWMLETLEALAGRRIDRVRAIGAAIEDERVREVRTAVLPWPLEVALSAEAVAVGAAVVAAVAGGLQGLQDALAGAVAVVPAEAPRDADAARAYDEAYHVRS